VQRRDVVTGHGPAAGSQRRNSGAAMDFDGAVAYALTPDELN